MELKVGFLALAALLIFAATMTQTLRTVPTRVIVLVNLVTVPPGTALLAHVVTEDWLFSVLFAGLLSAVAVPAVAFVVSNRARRISGNAG